MKVLREGMFCKECGVCVCVHEEKRWLFVIMENFFFWLQASWSCQEKKRKKSRNEGKREVDGLHVQG